ncbi:MAG TPA: glycoside hydrolase family 15 protein [Nitriliruptoraceae bacterium]|nr:glycoside hydrolase family 15 protein [Nitriliruptoraceae bacterium]
MSTQPIGEHALLSDCHTTALVDQRGSIEWLCLPNVDSPSVFARILDDDAGHFRLGPAAADPVVSRAYLGDSLVLETTFTTPTGTLVVTDALAMAMGSRGHELGHGSPHALLREARCTKGEVEVEVEVQPRLEYGLTIPLMREADDGSVTVRGGPTTLRLSGDVDLDVDTEGERIIASTMLRAGDAVHLALQYSSSWDHHPPSWTGERIADHLRDTVSAWQSWSADHQRFEGPYQDLVNHSGRVLQGLIHVPTGAMVAAPTTSLPETVGGERNWDYRYAWIRDSSFALEALWVAACPSEAGTFLDFLTTAATTVQRSSHLQIMFGIDGRRDLTERTLDHLGGWRDSTPVRIGNGAWDQQQIDVYGELLDAVHRLRRQIGTLDADEREFLVGLADAAAMVWDTPDQGIWEIRGEPRHHTHSVLMCWVALDRAIDMADWLGAADRVEEWSAARDVIRRAILERGWDDDVGAFTQAFDNDWLDASCLVISLVGFLPGDDERVVATIDAIADQLTDERGLVYRYLGDDGLEGEEGTFLLCTFWLAEALARAGQFERARRVFEQAASHRNDVDLLAEEVDSASGDLLGNFPQAFSHIGLVNAAWAIAACEAGEDPDGPFDRWADHDAP